MSHSAQVHSIQDLLELRIALGQFCEATQQSLTQIKSEIQRIQEWLKQRHDYWQKQVDCCSRAVSHAQQALSHCQQKKEGDCQGYSERVSEARHVLREALEEFEKVKHWNKIVEQAIANYTRQTNRLEQQFHHDIPKARVFLERKCRQLEGYLAVSPISTGRQVGKPEEGSSENTPTGILTTDGIRNVRVNQVLNVETAHVKGKADFHKVSYEDMVEGFRKLKSIVLPAVEEGADGTYFSRIDSQKNLNYKNGYRKIYDVFYGDDCIRVVNLGNNRYEIDKGHHRLFVAKKLAWETIPAQVVSIPSNEISEN